MAKKKISKPQINDNIQKDFQEKISDKNGTGIEKLDEMTASILDKMSDEEFDELGTMFNLASRGVTPEKYEQFYHIFNIIGSQVGKINDEEEDNFFSPMNRNFGMKRSTIKEYKPLKNAKDITLVLKIQMKGVSKPPMWREVEVPAHYTFTELHEVIQEVVGLDDDHLWQFNKTAYDDTLQIGELMDEEYGKGVDYVTNEAEETTLTQFLQQKGDKLEYTYDFGDDWIFVIEVKDIIDKKSEYAVCIKFKSELNAIEDFGGVWAYESARAYMENWDKMSKKEREKKADEQGFENANEYLEFLNENRISLDDVNDALQMI